MSLDVTIRQRMFGNKPLPLEVILGDQLSYGDYRNDCLRENVLGETEFVAYDAAHIGRGFSVVWNPAEKEQVYLRLLHPTSEAELDAFYKAVRRIAEYWGGSLTVDGKRTSLKSFLSTFEDSVQFNRDAAKQFFVEDILSGKSEIMTLYSAKWPLFVGHKEAEMFAANPRYFETWMHEKQAVSARYGAMRLYCVNGEYIGIFDCEAGYPYIFPDSPRVPYGITNGNTGSALKSEEIQWIIWLDDYDSDGLLELPYASFVERIPEAKKSYYDAGQFLLEPLSEEEIRAMTFDAKPAKYE